MKVVIFPIGLSAHEKSPLPLADFRVFAPLPSSFQFQAAILSKIYAYLVYRVHTVEAMVPNHS